MKINLCMIGHGMTAGDSGIHATRIVRGLGIRYEGAECFSIGDRWTFYGVDPMSVPNQLPKYITVIDGDEINE